MENMEIRNLAKRKGVCLWAVAIEMGISEATLTRRLRVELPEPEKNRISGIISSIAERNGRGNRCRMS